MDSRLTVAQAAKELGVGVAEVRMRMRTGEWNLGRVQKVNQHNKYLIYPDLLAAHKLNLSPRDYMRLKSEIEK